MGEKLWGSYLVCEGHWVYLSLQIERRKSLHSALGRVEVPLGHRSFCTRMPHSHSAIPWLLLLHSINIIRNEVQYTFFGVFFSFVCLQFGFQGALLNAGSLTIKGFVWAFHYLSRAEPNEMSYHHSFSVQWEMAHSSQQPECAAIKFIPRATKAFSELKFLLHCTLQDVTHLFNSSSTVLVDNTWKE